MPIPELEGHTTPGATIIASEPGHWRLSIPAGPAEHYRYAQLDDYRHRTRSAFRWQPPLRLSLRARISHAALPGTWGFGLWNDPFSASLGLGGASRRLPALPNAAWFFYASPPNYLAVWDDHPAQGFLAATFSAPHVPLPLMALGLPALPALAWPPTARYLRRLARRLIREAAASIEVGASEWHSYALQWLADRVRFWVDEQLCFETAVVPRPRLGLVLWIDNQYAAFSPQGHLRFGKLANEEPAWLELGDTCVSIREGD